MKKVVVIGAGGFGREVIEIFNDQNKLKKKWNMLGFIDDNKELHGKIVNNYPVLGGLEWLEENNDENLGCVCGIGTPETTKKIVEKLHKIDVKFYNAIHPSVIMSEFVELGEGVIICAGSILTVNIKIGNHVIINLNCTVGHNSILEDYCLLNPTAKINGYNHLCEGVYVGTGATFLHGTEGNMLTVGPWSTIGAGAVVIKDIPENVVAVGIPAKVIKQKEK